MPAVLALLFVVACRIPIDLGAAGASGPGALPPERNKRRFQVRLQLEVAPQPGQTDSARVWVPYPVDGLDQTITNLRWESKTAFHLTSGSASYGNRFLFAHFPMSEGLKLELSWQVTRRQAMYESGRDVLADENLGIFLEGPDADFLEALRLVILSTGDTDLELVEAAYRALLARLEFDPTCAHHGDIEAVVSDGKGDSFDYTAAYGALTRGLALPTKVKVGYVLPQDISQAWRELTALRSWVEIYTDSFGWVPVDPTSGDTRPERRGFYMGHLDADRVVLSTGTSITLSPPQSGAALPYFARPYLESEDGEMTPSHFSMQFRDL